MKNEIVLFEDGDVSIEVQVSPEQETVWLTRNQIAELFDRDVKTIGKHISNALREELGEEVVVAKFATTTQHGAIKGKTQTHMTEYYNLDVIISVGYRVKSQRGIAFRRWANSVLKDYVLKGYALNNKRLEALNRTVEIQSKMISSLIETPQDEVYEVVGRYTDALTLLDEYDHHELKRPEGNDATYRIDYKECRELIDSIAADSDIFGIEKERGKLEGILAAVYQNVFGTEVYPSLEEKATNLLYFLIKDHPFIDGNKRIGATVFLEFLNRNHSLFKEGRQIISNSALVAITLMVAESDPKEKEIMITLIMKFLME
ncbi:MAG: virulence RhuM family protein [Erysipelotrichaceae bacterium]|nr:virulence RhuM family protein [Erysipelotrichaceae bacterium]